MPTETRTAAMLRRQRAARRSQALLLLVSFACVVGVTYLGGFTRQAGAFVGLIGLCTLALYDIVGMRHQKLWRSTRMPLFTRMRFGKKGAAVTCAYCRDAIDSSSHTTCSGCQVAYHTECQDEMLGGCGTIGCSEATPRVRLTHPGKAKLAKPRKV